jgi:lipopolysaccharide transport system ATP-binding protein
MPAVIKVENLSKAYQLGEIGTGTISRDLERFWARMRGKEDPFLKIGEINDRTKKGVSDIVWGLKDLNFEIEQGDAVGIIGRNGAGKSTLLKILSRVTSPTTGTVKVKGRIASLLEVGTGFHPELSGRENIYLNGAILGMRKAEIRRKFDEIVDFSGVDRYIDTPVKRYSSGMYVRLAFAVAAHLESEILIVDEVLSVGDAEFQKKCLGKMGDVSKGEGRTILFVSHNMGSVRRLCNNAFLMDNGNIILQASAEKVINYYNSKSLELKLGDDISISKCKRFTLEKPFWMDALDNKTNIYTVGEKMILCFNFTFNEPVKKINPGFAILDFQDQRIFTSHLNDDDDFSFDGYLTGNVMLKTVIDLSLSPSTYKVIYGVRDEFDNTVIYEENVSLVIEESVSKNGASGILWHTTKWELEKP